MTNIPRLYIDAPLAEGLDAPLTAAQSHYLSHVMRRENGCSVLLFNGKDGEWLASLREAKKSALSAIVNHQTRPQTPCSGPKLLCALIKKTPFDTMIQKATELGVSEICPMLTKRTQVREINALHARSIAIEAAEQSERLSVPPINNAQKLDKIIKKWPQNTLPIVCAERGNALPVREAFQRLKIHENQEVAIFVGPEGGFCEEEMDVLKTLPGAVSVRLGPRILRADTAALSVLSCWQALCGDWRQCVRVAHG